MKDVFSLTPNELRIELEKESKKKYSFDNSHYELYDIELLDDDCDLGDEWDDDEDE